MKPIVSILILFLSGTLSAQAQQRMTIAAALDTALKNNQQLFINQAEIKTAGLTVKTASELPKTAVFGENEDLRPSDKKGILKIGITQSIAWPGLYTARKNYFKEQLEHAELNKVSLQAIIKRDVRGTYYQLWYLQDRLRLFQQLDSIYTSLDQATALRLKAGDVPGLDKIAAEARMKETQVLLQQNIKDMTAEQQQLMLLLNRNEWMLPAGAALEKIDFSVAQKELHPLLRLQQQNIDIASANVAVQKNSNRPEFSGRFFTQQLWGASDPFTGFSVSAAFPLLGASAYKNRVRAANAAKEVQQKQLAYQTQQLETLQKTAITEIEKLLSMIRFYESTGLQQADEIIKAATLSYRSGEISFAEMSQFLGQAITMRQNYLEVLNQYNQRVIQFDYINNN